MRNPFHRKAVLILGLSFVWPTMGRADERFWLDARINTQRVRLQFDSGSDRLFLHRPAAERLGFKLPPPAKSPVPKPYWAKEKCTLSFSDISEKTRFVILEYPSYVPPDEGEDGLLGWGHVNKQIIRIDASQGMVEFLREVPIEALGWTKLRLSTKFSILALEVPNTKGSTGIIIVDSGSESGIGLPPRKWQDWRAAHPNQPTTLLSGYNVKAGFMVQAQAWAEELSIGPLALTSVIVEEVDPMTAKTGGTRHVATWGMAALKRLDFIVDGKQRVAYLRPKNTPPLPYPHHNRLGATWVPRDPRSEDLILQVADGSPAFKAGIRNGDVLVKVGDFEVTKSNPAPYKGPFVYSPAGTKFELTLKRGGEKLSVSVVLQDILAPHTTSRPSSAK